MFVPKSVIMRQSHTPWIPLCVGFLLFLWEKSFTVLLENGVMIGRTDEPSLISIQLMSPWFCFVRKSEIYRYRNKTWQSNFLQKAELKMKSWLNSLSAELASEESSDTSRGVCEKSNGTSGCVTPYISKQGIPSTTKQVWLENPFVVTGGSIMG